MSAILASGLTKSFGPRTALAGVDLEIGYGESVTVVGPNGAGKTTLLRVLGTLSRPTSGTLTVAGLDPSRHGEEIRRSLGFISHRTLLYDDLTAEQNLRFYARMYDLPRDARRVDDLLEQLGLSARRHDLVQTYSRGMKQRLSVARAVLHSPRLLLLDEPYTGLDPQAAELLSALLEELVDGGCAILLTTHRLGRAPNAGDRVVILHQGRIVYEAGRATLSREEFSDIYRSFTA